MTSFDEKYRKRTPVSDKTQAPPAASTIETVKAPVESEKQEYKAYNATSHPEFELWIRPNAANDDTDTSMPYSYRNHMITDGSGFVISMHFNTPIICVTVQGRNLGDLFRKLLKHEVEWVMEFDPRKWANPPADAPCITGIQIARKPIPDKKTADDSLPGEKKPTDKTAAH